MRYVVGYGPDQRGIDGLNLASTLARSQEATLDVVSVLPSDAPSFHIYSPDQIYNTKVEEHGRGWLDDGLARVPEDVQAVGQLRRADSIAQGLIDAAIEPERGPVADMIVVGTRHRVRTGGIMLGNLADSLLHTSPVPVALAPSEYRLHSGITRVTCATGARQGVETLVNFAIRLAAAAHVPLRLMSLVALGEDGSPEQQKEWTELAELHAANLAEKAAGELPAESAVSTAVGHGRSLGDAVEMLEFVPGEIVVVGSSRLAQPKRLFIGTSASRIMRVLPVPMIMVPRDHESPAR